MAFTVATQLLVDGPRNTVSQTTGDFVMSSLPTGTIILNPSNLTDMNPGMSGTHKATLLRIDQIDYSISDNLTVQLYWDATSPVAICELYGRGKIEIKKYGGFQNYAGAGVTGNIGMNVILGDGGVTTNTGTILLVINAIKFRPISTGGA